MRFSRPTARTPRRSRRQQQRTREAVPNKHRHHSRRRHHNSSSNFHSRNNRSRRCYPPCRRCQRRRHRPPLRLRCQLLRLSPRSRCSPPLRRRWRPRLPAGTARDVQTIIPPRPDKKHGARFSFSFSLLRPSAFVSYVMRLGGGVSLGAESRAQWGTAEFELFLCARRRRASRLLSLLIAWRGIYACGGDGEGEGRGRGRGEEDKERGTGGEPRRMVGRSGRGERRTRRGGVGEGVEGVLPSPGRERLRREGMAGMV